MKTVKLMQKKEKKNEKKKKKKKTHGALSFKIRESTNQIIQKRLLGRLRRSWFRLDGRERGVEEGEERREKRRNWSQSNFSNVL